MQNYNLSITKGTETLRSAISIGYFNQQGTLLNNDFQRFTMRANIDANLSKTVTVGLNIAPSFSIRNLVEAEGHFDQGIITQAYLNSPLPTVYQADGNFTPNITSTGIFNNANPVNMLVNTKRLANNFRSEQVAGGLDHDPEFRPVLPAERGNPEVQNRFSNCLQENFAARQDDGARLFAIAVCAVNVSHPRGKVVYDL